MQINAVEVKEFMENHRDSFCELLFFFFWVRWFSLCVQLRANYSLPSYAQIMLTTWLLEFRNLSQTRRERRPRKEIVSDTLYLCRVSSDV